jgi:hypothetical protein
MRKLHRDLVRQPKGEFPIHAIAITTTQSPRVVHCKVNHEPPRGGVPLNKQKEFRGLKLKLKLKFRENRAMKDLKVDGQVVLIFMFSSIHQAPWSMCDDLRTV